MSAARHCHQSFNDLISRLCNQRRFSDALHHFFSSSSLPLTIFPSTYTRLFAACSALRATDSLRLIHRHLSLSSLSLTPTNTTVLLNNLLTAYGKCGAIDEARRLFDQMPHRNSVSWSSMISTFCQNNREEECVEVYVQMLQCNSTFPDNYALGSALRAASNLFDLELGKQLHVHAFKLNYRSESIVQNALVNMYSNCNCIDDAAFVFERIQEKDIVSWGAMISGLAKHGCELKSLFVFKDMLGYASINYRPNEFHCGSVLSACGSICLVEYGKQIHCFCVKLGLESDAHVGCSLSDMYARCGMLDSSKMVFYQIDYPDVVSWNSIICGLANGGLCNDAMLLFNEMRRTGVHPDNITLRGLLCGFLTCSSLCQGQLVHSFVLKHGFGSDVAVLNAMLSMYAKCSDLANVLYLFDEIGNGRDLISWNTIFGACLQHDQPEEVFRLFKLMCNLNEIFDHITLCMVFNSCANLGFLEMGNQVHAIALKYGLDADPVVTNALIDSYSKCGSLEDAKRVFKLLGNYHDVFSWSSLIVGYAQFGYGIEALELFRQMQKFGIRPNHVTFVGVLIACSREGLVDEGRRYYDMIETVYGVKPTREHCSCLVDLLARSGRLREAEKFINHMPVKPDIVIWKTLLAACREYKDIEIGERAAEGILKLDPYNSTAYVLLSNIYASVGCWDDVARLRKLMKGSRVRKLVGKSWIKVKGELQVFVADDKSHPGAEYIYFILEVLCFEMKEAGCEQQESYAFHWS